MFGCGSPTHLSRRTLLQAAGFGGLASSWLTPLAEALAWQEAQGIQTPSATARSVIVLWLEGGPSQIETFDPQPQGKIGDGTAAIATSVPGIQFAQGLEQSADWMHEILVIRSVVSREGDHERAVYNMKTGYRPDPSLVHPSLGAVVCHQWSDEQVEIPRHVSILPGAWPGRGGFLGEAYDAFQLGDPRNPLPDMTPAVSRDRFEQRLKDLSFVDRLYAEGVAQAEIAPASSEGDTEPLQGAAVRMMGSAQLKQFDLSDVPRAEKEPFGDSPFGRGCLVAARLVEAGVRCVEVTLGGWDAHITNREIHDRLKATLDPALASLLKYLKAHDRLRDTMVLVGGEFGRTPAINPAGGRDHWPHGFSIALAGGGIVGGRVLGATDPNGERVSYETGIAIADIHASVQHHLGIPSHYEFITPIGRPVKFSEGRVVF